MWYVPLSLYIIVFWRIEHGDKKKKLTTKNYLICTTICKNISLSGAKYTISTLLLLAFIVPCV